MHVGNTAENLGFSYCRDPKAAKHNSELDDDILAESAAEVLRDLGHVQ